jgi:hypothetical protein
MSVTVAAVRHILSGVTVVLPWCHRGVEMVLQWCYSGVLESQLVSDPRPK